MSEFDQIETRLKHLFEGKLESPRIRVFSDQPWKVLVQIVSSTFEGLDEGERQALVWQVLLDELAEFDRRRIEFIYTDAPSDLEDTDALLTHPTRS